MSPPKIAREVDFRLHLVKGAAKGNVRARGRPGLQRRRRATGSLGATPIGALIAGADAGGGQVGHGENAAAAHKAVVALTSA